mgnify:CR=1 FL=1
MKYLGIQLSDGIGIDSRKEVKQETPVVAQEETEVKATTVKRTRTTTKKVAE